MRWWVRTLTIATVLAGAVPAVAAEPPSLAAKACVLTAEPGAQRPNVAVDDMATGHFAWEADQPYPKTDTTVYCRVPRGATACQATQRFDIAPGLEAFGNPV